MKYFFVCLIVVLLCVPVQSYAVTFFDTDFETCSAGSGNDFPCESWVDTGAPVNPEFINAPNHNKIEVATDLPFTGTKSVKATFVNRLNPCALENPSIERTFTSSDHFFTRHAMRKSSGFQQGESSTKFRRWTADTTGGRSQYPVISAMLSNTGNHLVIVEGGYSMGTVVYQGGPPLSTTSWDQVEMEIKMNTPGVADGLLRMWVNGTLYIERLNLVLRGPTPTSTILINNIPTVVGSLTSYSRDQVFIQCGIGNIWVDRLATADARIGLVGSPPTPDTTPPQPPTNLTGNAASSTLTWTAGSDTGGSGYAGVQIFRCTRNPGDCTPTTFHATVSAPATSYVDTSAQAGFTYDYRLRSVDGVGLTSLYTSEVSLTIPTTTRVPSFTDIFNRADNADAGSNYTGGHTTAVALKIASNQLAASAINTRNLEAYNVAMPNDQWAMVKASDGVNATDNIHVQMRLSTPPGTWNAYECSVLNTTTLRIQRVDAGVGTGLFSGTLSSPFVVGDRLRGESQGTTHRCYRISTSAQGVQTEELGAVATDATYATGLVGVRISTTALPSVRLGEFVAGGFTGVVDDSIQHDATSTSAAANTSTSLSWSHTVGSGQNRLLTVCTQSRDTTTARTATAVTANGVSLVKFREDTRDVTGTKLYTSLWRQIAPSPGANTIVATFSGVPTSYAVGSASSWSGVEQVNPIDAVGGANGSGTAISLPITTTSTNTKVVDCVLGTDAMSASGQTILSNRLTTVGNDGALTSAKDVAAIGATTMTATHAGAANWSGSAMALKVAQTALSPRPLIASGSLSPTGALVTYGATTPTALRVTHGPNSGIGVQQVDIPIASAPGGVVSLTWPAGDEFATIAAIDSLGAANQTDLQYFASTLVGIAPPLTLDPVVMTNPQPSTELPAGTTSAIISMTVDQVALARECRWSDTDQAYTSMPTANQMVVNGTLATGTKTGLSNGQSYTVYRTCIIDDSGTPIESPSRVSSTFTVANTTVDVTPPGNVSNVIFLASGTQANGTWAAAVDAVSYEVFLSSDCVTYSLAGTPTGTSFTMMGLAQNTTYCAKVRARDVVGNQSAADSNISSFVIGTVADPIPPSNMQGMTVTPYQRSVLVRHEPCTDNISAASSVIEYCTGASCTPGESAQTAAVSPVLITTLTPGTVYRFQGHCYDGTNASAKTAVVEVTTPTTGLDAPRLDVQFGVERPAASREVSGTRLPRP